MDTVLINKFGKIGGWNSVTINFLGRDLEGISEVEYDDDLDIENIMGAGRMPIGQGDGNYSAKASITILNEERLAMLKALPAGGRIQDISFPIVATYEYGNEVFTDVIFNCRIKNNGVSVKQGDKSINHKFELVVSHVNWNV